MFLRSKRRRKDGKTHRYFSVVENRRVRSGRVVQRQVLFWGEINDSQQAAWRQTLEVFDEAEQRAATLSLFPEDRDIPADALDGVQVKLAEMELRRPRAFGNYWLGCELCRQLGLEEFWQAWLGEGREEVPWAHSVQLWGDQEERGRRSGGGSGSYSSSAGCDWWWWPVRYSRRY